MLGMKLIGHVLTDLYNSVIFEFKEYLCKLNLYAPV
jgi:hypothetical protein